MKNHELFQHDLARRQLLNKGVATVVEDATRQYGSDVLRFELESFVCEGQYRKGLERILSSYLGNLSGSEQAGVWISGFYGSGKSHLAKVLKALWVDTPFADGASARGITRLPDDVKHQLVELKTRAQQFGGLHAASGTMTGSEQESLRVAVCGLVFKSLGFHERYNVGKFLIWLRKEGVLERVKQLIHDQGDNWQEELDNFDVSESLYSAVNTVLPNVLSRDKSVGDAFEQAFPNKRDITSDEMVATITAALTRDGKFPLTLLVLDEVQQYIGDSAHKALQVQDIAETINKRFGGRILLVATGQSAISGTPNLAKLEGRFPVRVELSDADVNAVVREVVLAKKPEAIPALKKLALDNNGELSKHLAGSRLAFSREDFDNFPRDYPLLPTRRRFWDEVLRSMDPHGKDSQLRNQLSMTLSAVQERLDAPLGAVVPADFVYFHLASTLLQGHLPSEIHKVTVGRMDGSESDKLFARAYALVFLIGKLGTRGTDLGIRANTATIAQLMIEDITAGSDKLRDQLEKLLDNPELIKIGDSYSIQTARSLEWTQTFRKYQDRLAQDRVGIDSERESRIKELVQALVGKLKRQHGASKEPRAVSAFFGAGLPSEIGNGLHVVVRTGWEDDRGAVETEARKLGTDSPTAYLYLPRTSPDDLQAKLKDYLASKRTLDERGTSSDPDDVSARASMQTRFDSADAAITDILNAAIDGAEVFIAGGAKVEAGSTINSLTQAVDKCIDRLYPRFKEGDHALWHKVFDRTQKGEPDTLKYIEWDGPPADHPVCKELMEQIRSNGKGSKVIAALEAPPYGWPRDAIDGAFAVLLFSEHISGEDDKKQPLSAKGLDRKTIGKSIFKVEKITISSAQRVALRRLFVAVGIPCKSGEEPSAMEELLSKAKTLEQDAGGEPPLPVRAKLIWMKDLENASGNERLLNALDHKLQIEADLKQLEETSRKIKDRLPDWQLLENLAERLPDGEVAARIRSTMDSIRTQRLLLETPDPVASLLSAATEFHRKSINSAVKRFDAEHEKGMHRLESEAGWQALTPEDRHAILSAHSLAEDSKPSVSLASSHEVASTLSVLPYEALESSIDALPQRFDRAFEALLRKCEPNIRPFSIPRRTIRTPEELDSWIEEIWDRLREELKNGPINLQ